MDTDAKYLKRKVKAGALDVHPTEKALVVNYELEATILGELGDPMLGERKECQKIIRLKSLNSNTDIEVLSKEVINKCKLIHPSKQPEVEQLLYYLQNRKPRSDQGSEDDKGTSQPSSLHRYSPIESLKDDEPAELANINYLDDYIDLLYDDSSKIRGSALILQLARNPDNLEELSQNETLLGALSRVLREEWRKSIELTTNIVYVFFCFSTFYQFHSIIAHYKIGSLVMEIVENEIVRHQQWAEDLKRKGILKTENESKTEMKQFQEYVTKQEQTLRVSVYLLLNISEDTKVEEKMVKRKIVFILVSLLDRKNHELLILVTSFLKKLSCYLVNKEEMKLLNVAEKLTPLLTTENPDLTNSAVRLLLNLSFDTDHRTAMVKSGMLPKLVNLMNDSKVQNPVCCVLYHLSMDDKVKSMFTYTECIPVVMKMILDSCEEQVDLEVMALAINLAANKRNAQLICEGHGLRVLMQRAFHYQDALVMKMIRNISQHEGVTKNLFIEFIGDIADAVQRADSEEFVLECVGILGNLNFSDLDFERLLTEYDLVPWIKKKLSPPFNTEDDLVLEIVVFLGTCITDISAAHLICKHAILERLIELLKAKQEDDEMVLQVVFVFHQLCLHPEIRKFIIHNTEAVAYLIDLMHDRNPEVQKLCDATLDIISLHDESWHNRVKREKFRFHNAQWLEIVEGQRAAQDHDLLFSYGGDDDEDDEFEQLLRESEELEADAPLLY